MCRIVSFRPWDSCGECLRDPHLWGFCGTAQAPSKPGDAQFAASSPLNGDFPHLPEIGGLDAARRLPSSDSVRPQGSHHPPASVVVARSASCAVGAFLQVRSLPSRAACLAGRNRDCARETPRQDMKAETAYLTRHGPLLRLPRQASPQRPRETPETYTAHPQPRDSDSCAETVPACGGDCHPAQPNKLSARLHRRPAGSEYSAGTRRPDVPVTLSDCGWSAAVTRDPPYLHAFGAVRQWTLPPYRTVILCAA